MCLLHPHRLLPVVRLDDFVHLRNPQFGARRFRCVQVSCSLEKSLVQDKVERHMQFDKNEHL